MVDVKPISDVVAKWKARAAVAEPDYRKGISNAKDWQGKTEAAAGRYTQGVQNAIANNSFGKGVKNSSNDDWKNGALNKGAARFSQGVNAAEGKFNRGIGKVLDTIASVTLPDKQPKGSPANYERVKAIGDALHKMKTGG